ncbi:hypothetical protein RvY_13077-2 [Ramazzottius varieornatus]|uniref:Dehydrogenase E1 component domain-containing protein n=1 Tax=Ramazzottius varieornatus TaxID=947166 RepID=A0A1D1VLN0_RAMVA|nr:hypothetical protein RvY_13077-2 [Ramazzottius varieornatus]
MLRAVLAARSPACVHNGRYLYSSWTAHAQVNVRSSAPDNIVENSSQTGNHREQGPATAENLPAAVRRFVDAYRTHGHKTAAIDPLGLWIPMRDVPELDPLAYGLTKDVEVNGYLSLGQRTTLQNLTQALLHTYSSKISVEFEHMIHQEERQWFAQRFEQLMGEPIPAEVKKQVGKILLKTAVFDSFLANKFPTLKRYGGEGAEGNLVFVDEIIRLAFAGDYHDVIACMPHRGRLNVLTVNLGYDPSYMFRKISGKSEFPDDVKATGDVLSHLFTSTDLTAEDGKKLHFSLIPNPSHLEANNPVAVGKARGRQQSLQAGYYRRDQENDKKVLCVQIHGDASFTGQGIIAETFGFADLPHYSVGGSMHLITNNQVGFTTTTGRSSIYASDAAKINSCPVIHVNGESPEDIIRATKLGFEYRERFGKDVVIDLLCYRLHGHNEVDDPTMTQPVMYNAIKARKSVPVLYSEALRQEGQLTEEESRKVSEEYDGSLRQALSQLDQFKPKVRMCPFKLPL